MIISHLHRFIFIKTKKTAGTSLEIALSGICGPDDVITPITPGDELIRQSLGFRGPQNHAPAGREPFFNHIGAAAVQQAVGPDVWRSYFTFCFERNPWDKVISWYYWERQFHPEMSLDEFIASGRFASVGGPGGYDLYTTNGVVIVDRVCRYEDMETELRALAKRMNVAAIPPLPRAKSEFRHDRRHYREILSTSQRESIAIAFQREIELMGYTF